MPITTIIPLLLVSVIINPTICDGYLDSWWWWDSDNPSKCFGELGCIEYTPEWYDKLRRPINKLPEDRDIIDTGFYLSKSNVLVTEFHKVSLNKEELLSHGFNPSIPTKFLVHGFKDSYKSEGFPEMAKALHDAGLYNVFVVNWEKGANGLYTQAVGNTWLVGQEIAHMILYLKEQSDFSVKAEDCHCIGHSLGSHICGYAGAKLNGSLGRITGLDPAGPGYQYMPQIVRLDPSDAKLVDNIHTNGMSGYMGDTLGFGLIDPYGHMDFYPNGGQMQPGCDASTIIASVYSGGIDAVVTEVLTCNHHRAISFFIEATATSHQNRSCKFVGHVCDDYDQYLQGKCGYCLEDGSNCAFMGLRADEYPIGTRSLVKFYLSTAAQAPFCLSHYLATVELAFPKGIADERIIGQLKLSLSGSKRSYNDASWSRAVNASINEGGNMTFLIESPKNLGEIRRAKVKWNSVGRRIVDNIEYTVWCVVYLQCNFKMFIHKIFVGDMDTMEIISSHGQNKNQLKSSHFQNSRSKEFCGEKDSNLTVISSGFSATFQKSC